jgi:sigma-54 specific flagellar transcriptional regulator A
MATSEATVLLTGETGTGKEVFARQIHEMSPRAKKAFVPVNCGAIPEALLESELFGHVRGAFTGAANNRRGRVALADGGTLFLDEIGELPLALQVKLLRLLQERSYEPVGSAESIPANFRLIAATNRNLAHEVEAGRFRRDLFYRLLVCPLELPALRSRKNDIRKLFTHFWMARGETRPVEGEVFQALDAYPWPGNVRELENLVERVSVCSEGPSIRMADLPLEIRRPLLSLVSSGGAKPAEPPPPPAVPLHLLSENEEVPFIPPAAIHPSEALHPVPTKAVGDLRQLPIDLPRILRELEDTYIEAALAQANGNKKLAAELLGLQRTTLVEKLRRRAKQEPAPV